MNSATVRNVLLGFIALTVVVIAVVLIREQGGLGGGPRKHTEEWQQIHDVYRGSAYLACSYTVTDIESPAFDSCVKAEVDEKMELWEKSNGGKVWE